MSETELSLSDMITKPLTYLACPYSHPNPAVREARYKAVTKCAARIMELDPSINIFSPITHSHPLHVEGGLAGNWERWAKVDEEYINVSAIMYVLCLRDWDRSVGVKAEIKIAKSAGVSVWYIHPKDYDLEDVDPADYELGLRYGPTGQHIEVKAGSGVGCCGNSTTEGPVGIPGGCIKGLDKSNPKDLIGSRKVSITKFPAAALLHGAHAMGNGAAKYGSYNWRGNPVRASIYVDAAIRHLLAWFEGEEKAADSGVHHLGHALASIAIILDAQETANLINDRPAATIVATTVLDRLNSKLKKESGSK